MKKLVTIAAAAALVAMASTSFAAAGSTSANLTTSATVLAACKATAFDTIAFGNLDPTIDSGFKNAATKGSVLVQCTEGTVYSFAYDAASSVKLDGTGFAIPVYAVQNLVPVAGTIAGTTYLVDAQVNAADYVGAPAGAYSGTFTLTVNY